MIVTILHRIQTLPRTTLRGYRSDWAELTRRCTGAGADPLPATAVSITGYLTMLTGAFPAGTAPVNLAVTVARHADQRPGPVWADR
ncbi:hypothetical protein [Nakamurella panacisegetis]|uniref:hypothetical protein n=1 Tax=Nakamurella panacisegetis TaxID=1090615 RepID=UPI0012FE14B3|nr:hypothetical protein [Nakamurella panacisegetis]